MPRNLPLRLLSAVAGATAVVMLTVLVGMSPRPPTAEPAIFVQGLPTASTMVRIPEGRTLKVPAAMHFVVTGAGNSFTHGNFQSIRFDDETVLVVGGDHSVGMVVIPPGLVAGPGTTVSVASDPPGQGLVLGYLEDV